MIKIAFYNISMEARTPDLTKKPHGQYYKFTYLISDIKNNINRIEF